MIQFRPRRPPRIVDAIFRHSHSHATLHKNESQSSARTSLPSLFNKTPHNAAGVQLLTPSLRAQLFPTSTFPPPPQHTIHRSLEHLSQHGLDTSSASSLPPLELPLPPLVGQNLDEHFHRLGRAYAEPSLSLSRAFARVTLPLVPETWALVSGWTMYTSDGSCEPVPHLPEDEQAAVFDVETMPHYSPYPVIACAATERAWYSWLSPWILGESSDPQHLIPLGPVGVVVGHNVAFDRQRVREEYDLRGTGTTWVDTMSLHIATHGISSHQRPAWNKYKAGRRAARVRAVESVDAVRGLIEEYERELGELEGEGREEMERRIQELQEGLQALILQQEEGAGVFSDDAVTVSLAATSDPDPDPDSDSDLNETDPQRGKRWEEMSSGNSLVDVARLHCGLTIEKDAREDLLTFSREEITRDLPAYIGYCAGDVATTHEVFRVVLPSFLATCPSPVTWAGVGTMGQSFLPVDEGWEHYIRKAENKYRELEGRVKRNLEMLAEKARYGGWEGAKGDVWLEQLDWEMKRKKRARGAGAGAGEGAGEEQGVPAWYWEFTAHPPLAEQNVRQFLPLVLKLSIGGSALVYSPKVGWVCRVPFTEPPVEAPFAAGEGREGQGQGEGRGGEGQGKEGKGQEGRWYKLGRAAAHKLLAKRFRGLEAGGASPSGGEGAGDGGEKSVWRRLGEGERGEQLEAEVMRLVERLREEGMRLGFGREGEDPWEAQLDWTLVTPRPPPTADKSETWPKWYWDLCTSSAPGEQPKLEITPRSRVAPLLLKLRWQGYPLFYSRQHGWTYRVPPSSVSTHKTRQKPLSFTHDDDLPLAQAVEGGSGFYKLPHKAGEESNVGNPLAKTFVKYASDGILTADNGEDADADAQRCAADAMDMNAQCSYWISARDRVMNQMVVWQDQATSASALDMGFANEPNNQAPGKKRGIILPQVIAMGTVTRRAIEKTWLTASNAKPNRVGSELKAMVRAPEGYSIVGADVDSEELWISSVMGDAQFGMHGATAIGWMTLEGTKANGTDLHSKTANILGISRDQAKIFNYSRIYGAGLKHAQLLMLQSNPKLLVDDAKSLVQKLYASTKGQTTRTDRFFDRKFWFGGTESFLFNKLEEIALSDKPLTPALGCGITRALTKEYLDPSEYLPSRINWVVQSSGVDYLHLLIVAMRYLIHKYDISARYLISVHDELRYLVKDEDRYRAALALQIANIWTRSLFSFKLGMDDLPQGVAFFSAVDIDKYLRKETDMTCVTPSQTEPLPPGQSLDIEQLLKVTNGGILSAPGKTMPESKEEVGDLEGYVPPDCMIHRSTSPAWLRAQATSELSEIRMLWKAEQEKSGKGKKLKTKPTKAEGKSEKPKRATPKRQAGTQVVTVTAAPITLELWAEQQANNILMKKM
ncbi:hypothetical protein DACRYDRAFT_94814 [Dacryopinax primogenitus]|uniref:Mitochondrial DNA polymerase catalytic subunit n=1 Tax=Dacryopinax primogenitus (strain DJM 731) TaxID=1858805 RepID=M5FVG1_DACPD|nr:uncharacterized protein DACRYDRAFT_94814 [Dacryopinax primogenitus]EJU01791.1 hypothetical protein DACRYDRAFT_94814 [Dacryopinax primogenitus]